MVGCTDCPDDKGTESKGPLFPCKASRSCTDCPDDKGTERLVAQATAFEKTMRCTDCPDDKGTESLLSARPETGRFLVAPIAPMTRGLKV